MVSLSNYALFMQAVKNKRTLIFGQFFKRSSFTIISKVAKIALVHFFFLFFSYKTNFAPFFLQSFNKFLFFLTFIDNIYVFFFPLLESFAKIFHNFLTKCVFYDSTSIFQLNDWITLFFYSLIRFIFFSLSLLMKFGFLAILYQKPDFSAILWQNLCFFHDPLKNCGLFCDLLKIFTLF